LKALNKTFLYFIEICVVDVTTDTDFISGPSWFDSGGGGGDVGLQKCVLLQFVPSFEADDVILHV